MKFQKLILILLAVFASLIILNELSLTYLWQILFPLLKAILLLVDVFSIGYLFQKHFKSKNIELGESVAYGLIVTAFYFYMISFLKILNPVSVYIFLILPIIVMLLSFPKQKTSLLENIRSVMDLPKPLYLIFLIPFVYASLPPTFYDSLVYHLGIPNLYLLNGGFVETSQFLYANTSVYYEIALIPSVFLGDLVPRFFHFFIGLVLIIEMVKFGVEFFYIKKRSVIFLSLISIPLSLFLLTTVKNDLLSALFILMGIKHFLRKNNIPSGIFWGFSIGIKYFNVLPMILFLVIFAFKEKKIYAKKAAIFGIIVLCVLGPLFLKNFIFQKNPFFPFLSGELKSEFWDMSRSQLMRADVGAVIHDLKDLLKFPYTFSFRELGYGGVVGIQFLVLLPFLLLGIKCRKDLLIFSFLSLAIGSIFTGSIRFLYPSIILLSLYVAVVYEYINNRIIKVFFFLVISFNFIFSFALLERLNQAHFLYSGKMNTDQYISAFNPIYPAVSHANKNLPVNAKIMIVGEPRNYYLKRQYLVSSAIDYSIMKKFLVQSENITMFRRVMAERNIGFILFHPEEFNRLQKTYNRLNVNETKKMLAFFEQLSVEYHQGGVIIFSVRE